MRRPTHSSTVGILLCTGRNEAIVRYALSGAAAPVAVATYDALPPDELTAALGDALNASDDGSSEPLEASAMTSPT